MICSEAKDDLQEEDEGQEGRIEAGDTRGLSAPNQRDNIKT